MRPLIYQPSPLAYPGGAPGFDPTHPAAAGIRMSVAASPSSTTFIDILHGKTTTPSGTVGAMMQGTIGPALQSTTGFILSGNPAIVDSVYMFATIVIVTAALGGGGNGSIIDTSSVGGSTTGTVFGVYTPSSTPFFSVAWPGHASYVSNISPTFSVPYFVACNWILSSGTAYFVAVNMLTGAVKTSTVTGTTTAVSTSNGSYIIGSDFGGATNYLRGYVAAAMWSTVTLGPPGILQMAQRPWDFWYPLSAQQFLFTSLRAPLLTRRPYVQGMIIG